VRSAAVLIAAVLVTACAGGAVATPMTTTGGSIVANATVASIVDGDTIHATVDGVDERVRLIGIDTPEVAHPASGDRPPQAAECFGDAATDFTASLIPVGTPIRLERDVVGRDDYGRLLAYVYRASDGVLVNYEIVRHGFAQPLTIPPNVAHSELFVGAARRAEQDDVGLWSACD